jgi:membrane protein implicated in regulation of membrane protease activity
MAPWVVWLLVAGGLAAVELLTLDFVFAMLAVAALAAAGVAALTDSQAAALAAFAVSAVATLVVVRPRIKARLQPRLVRDNTQALTGMTAVVLQEVTSTAGLVRLGGEVWTARTYTDDERLLPGRRVVVVEIDGATAMVFGDPELDAAADGGSDPSSPRSPEDPA